ncbi:MAG TPA: flagellar motor switch protein FliN [Bryobacteraceae bacterium]|jgi:flagellar motor switch protein FliN/FliY
MADGAERSEILQWIVRTLSDQLSQVFDTMAGESPLIEAESLASAPVLSDSLVWEVPVSLVPFAPVWLQASRDSWYSLGNRVLAAAGLDGSDDQTIQDTFKEAMDQAFAGLTREMTNKAGREVTATSSKLTISSPPVRAAWSRLELIFGDNKSAPVIFGFNEEMIEKLGEKSTPVIPVQPKANAAVAASAGPRIASSQPESRTLDLLLDVELPISVSFGRAHLPLKEVMKLTTGSIVELNRTISEPVDIIVNNCVIARGEVVVVEGNFGVRIQEVISRQERLRTLY